MDHCLLGRSGDFSGYSGEERGRAKELGWEESGMWNFWDLHLITSMTWRMLRSLWVVWYGGGMGTDVMDIDWLG